MYMQKVSPSLTMLHFLILNKSYLLFYFTLPFFSFISFLVSSFLFLVLFIIDKVISCGCITRKESRFKIETVLRIRQILHHLQSIFLEYDFPVNASNNSAIVNTIDEKLFTCRLYDSSCYVSFEPYITFASTLRTSNILGIIFGHFSRTFLLEVSTDQIKTIQAFFLYCCTSFLSYIPYIHNYYYISRSQFLILENSLGFHFYILDIYHLDQVEHFLICFVP